MRKRGQVTVFIILGVVMLALVAVSFYYFSHDDVVEKITPIETTPIKFFVDNCLYQTVEDAILNNGKYGGYFELPKNSTTDLFENLPYFDQKTIPSKMIIGDHIVKYVDASLDSCIQGFDTFQNVYNISFTDPKSHAVIKHNKLILSTKFPLLIQQNNKGTQLSQFEVNFPINDLITALDVASTIAETKSANGVCLSCFAEKARQNNIEVQIMNLPNSTLLVELTSKQYLLDNKEYIFRFAMHLPAAEESDFELK